MLPKDGCTPSLAFNWSSMLLMISLPALCLVFLYPGSGFERATRVMHLWRNPSFRGTCAATFELFFAEDTFERIFWKELLPFILVGPYLGCLLGGHIRYDESGKFFMCRRLHRVTKVQFKCFLPLSHRYRKAKYAKPEVNGCSRKVTRERRKRYWKQRNGEE